MRCTGVPAVCCWWRWTGSTRGFRSTKWQRCSGRPPWGGSIFPLSRDGPPRRSGCTRRCRRRSPRGHWPIGRATLSIASSASDGIAAATTCGTCWSATASRLSSTPRTLSLDNRSSATSALTPAGFPPLSTTTVRCCMIRALPTSQPPTGSRLNLRRRSTILRSWGPDPPVWRPPCMAPPKGCAPLLWSRLRLGGRPAPAR